MSLSTLITVAFAGLLFPAPVALASPAASAGGDGGVGAGGEISSGAASAAGLYLIGTIVAAVVVAIVIGRWRLLRLRAAPRRHEPLSPVGGLGAAAMLLLAGQIGVSIVAQVSGIELAQGSRSVRETVLLGAGAYIPQVIGAILWLGAARRSTPRGAAPCSIPSATGAGLIALVLAWPLVSLAGLAAGLAVEALGGPERRPLAHETLRALVEQPWDLWATGLVVQSAILAPLVEEVLYRGCLQGAVVRLVGRWPGIVVVSGIFTVMHLGAADPGALAALFLLSVGFGLVYERTGRLTAPIAMHVGFNVANLGLALA